MSAKATGSDTRLIDRCASAVAREGWHHALERRDLVQIGWLAMLEAQARGRVPAADPHRSAYLRVRIMGAMRDARRSDMAALPDHYAELTDDTAAYETSAEDRCYVRQQAARFFSRPAATPAMRRALLLLLDGLTIGEAAKALGVSVSAVSQVLRRCEWTMAMLR